MQDNSYQNCNNYNGYSDNPFNSGVVFVSPPTKSELEKKDIKRKAATVGISCLVMIGITFFWATAFTAVLSLLGFTQADIKGFLSDPFILQAIQITLSSFMFTIPFILVYKISGYNISETVSLKKPEKYLALPLILMGIGFCAFSNIAVSIAGSIFEGFGINYNVDFGENPRGILGFILSFIATAIVPALVEEFACRGLILGSLKKYGEGFAVIASAAVFGLMHGNFQQIPFAFLVGLILGYITVKSGSIWLACLVHSANNSISVLMDYALGGLSNSAQNIIYNLYLMLAMLAAVIGVCLLHSKKEGILSFNSSDNECSEADKYKWFFISPFIIIFTIICIAQSLLYFII